MINNLIYTGTVRHRRYDRKSHAFSYPLFMFCFDINCIDMVFNNIPQVSNEKFNWFTFKKKNYFEQSTISLDECVRARIKQQCGIDATGKIVLLTQLSCFGYCFNPISLYFVFKPHHDELDFLIAEVTNTPWGEKHCYILNNPVKPKSDIYQYHFQKELHVSPFMTMNYAYQLRLKLDNQQIIVHMENHQNNQLHFDATLSLTAVQLSTTPALRVFLRFPLITYKVTAAIYWQALKLWLKGNRFYSHPQSSKDDSLND